MGRSGHSDDLVLLDEVTRSGFGDAMIDGDAIERTRRLRRLDVLCEELEQEQSNFSWPLLNEDLLLRQALMLNDPTEQVQRLLKAAIPHLLTPHEPPYGLSARLYSLLGLFAVRGEKESMDRIPSADLERIATACFKRLESEIESLRQKQVFVHSLRDFCGDVQQAATNEGALIASERLLALTPEARFFALFDDDQRFIHSSNVQAKENLRQILLGSYGSPAAIPWPESKQLATAFQLAARAVGQDDRLGLLAAIAIEQWPKVVRQFVALDFNANDPGYAEMMQVWKQSSDSSDQQA